MRDLLFSLGGFGIGYTLRDLWCHFGTYVKDWMRG
jgi:hypothetical protein